MRILVLTLILLGSLIGVKTSAEEMVTFDDLKAYHEESVKRKQAEYDRELSRQLIEKAELLRGRRAGQCVVFVRNFLQAAPADVSGMARNLKTNSDTPQIGAIGKTNESKYGHVFVVLAVGDTLTIADSNYGWDGRVRIREIPADSPKILGYKILTN